MPWRMIIILLILILVTLFSGFNLNRVDISVGFYVFKEIPLFLSLIIAFILGALVMLPFTIKSQKKKANRRKKDAISRESVPEELAPDIPPEDEIAEKRKKSKKKQK